MGNSVASAATPGHAVQDLQSYLNELPQFSYLSLLGNSKLMKSISCSSDGLGAVVVKMFIKQYPDLAASILAKYVAIAKDLQAKFSLDIKAQPSVLIPSIVYEGDKACYMIRQHFAANLYDRFHMHPYLTTIEKKWLAYQLLMAVAQIHALGFRHGDIKSENVLLTTWNWLFLTDLAFYKPTTLPADNPAYYGFFFETHKRTRCYLAPERFFHTSELEDQKETDPWLAPVTEAMDVFSVGCVIAEIFLEGEHQLFDLSQMLSYREEKYSPQNVLNKIPDVEVRGLISHMVQVDPTLRFSAQKYLDQWADKVFPSYFSSLYGLFAAMLAPEASTVDKKIQLLSQRKIQVVKDVAPQAVQYLARQIPVRKPPKDSKSGTSGSSRESLSAHERSHEKAVGHDRSSCSVSSCTRPSAATISCGGSTSNGGSSSAGGAVARCSSCSVSGGSSSSSLSSSQVQRLGSMSVAAPPPRAPVQWEYTIDQTTDFVRKVEQFSESLERSIDSAGSSLSAASGESFLEPAAASSLVASKIPVITPCEDAPGLTIVIGLICSCILNVRFPQTKLTALDLLLDFGLLVGDEVRLGRVVPYLVAMLNDDSPTVRVSVIKLLAQILARVQVLKENDELVFFEYILPALSRIPADQDELVQMAYAQCIASFANSAKTFLELAYMTKPVPSGFMAVQQSYDSELEGLRQTILKVVIDMLTLGGNKVKRALLEDISSLCIFMGRRLTNNDLLLHLITVLNDRDWELRTAFFHHIVGVSVYVGRESFEACVLPCIEQALVDPAEFVIQSAVHTLTAVCELGLFAKRLLLDILPKVQPLLVHPSPWICSETVNFIVAMSKYLGPAQTYCMMIPKLKPFLKFPMVQLTRDTLLKCLKDPITRQDFRRAIVRYGAGSSPSTIPISGNVNLLDFSLEQDGAEMHGFEEKRDEEDDVTADFSRRRKLFAGSDDDEAPPDNVSGSISSFTSDLELAGPMINYVQKVAAALQAECIRSTTKDELSAYVNLEADVPLHYIEVPQTCPEINFPSISQSHMIEQVQQDLYDSLGVNVPAMVIPPKDPTTGVRKPETWTAFSQGEARAGSILGGKALQRGLVLMNMVHQSINRLDPHVGKALAIPAPPRDLGALRRETVSYASFYQNHHVMDDMPATLECEPLSWKPKGILVSYLTEHKSSVNSLSVSRDNLFMVSGSDDGTVKIWDCERLVSVPEKPQSQWTHVQGGRVSCVTVCDSSHAVASASSEGTVHVIKVERAISTKSDEANRYAGATDIKRIDSVQGAVNHVVHFNTHSESLLAYSTQRGSVCGWDLRSKADAFKLSLDSGALGVISALCVGSTPHIIIAGTSRGYIIVWDLRYKTTVQTWRHSEKSRILSLSTEASPDILPKAQPLHHPAKGPLIFVSVEGGSHLTAFDMYTGECRLVFRVTQNDSTPLPRALAKRTSLSERERTRTLSASQQSKSVAARRVSPLTLPSLRAQAYSESKELGLDQVAIRELNEKKSDAQEGVHAFLWCREGYVLTAGSDRVIRHWDLNEPSESRHISGPDLSPMWARCSGSLQNNTVAYEEIIGSPLDGREGDILPSDDDIAMQQRYQLAKKGRGVTPTPTMHEDCILDLKAIEFPQKMLASASRDGVIKVWV